MTNEEFVKICQARDKHSNDLLIPKGEEYSRNGDRLHNFKRAMWLQLVPNTESAAAWNMLTKHLVSIMDIIDDLAMDKYPDDKLLADKFDDYHNYGRLVEAQIRENRDQIRNQEVVEVFHADH